MNLLTKTVAGALILASTLLAAETKPMNPALKLAPRTFPARVADLGFTASLPADWVLHDLPKQEVDISDPTAFFPLAVLTAPHSVIVYAFVARPAYEDGTLNDWAMYLLNHNKMTPRALGRHVVAGVPAVVGEATQESELGTMLMRFAFLEDGNRLINITLGAPELLADSVRDSWLELLKTFKLETPKGSRFKIDSHPDYQAAAATASNTVAKADEAAPRTEAVEPESVVAEGRAATEQAATEPAARSEADEKRKPTFFDFAFAPDATSLDPENPINANLRDNGVGLVPRVVAKDDAGRKATLAAGAILAQFDVPYGWHVIDDGQRTLILDPGNKVQINLNLVPRRDRSPDTVLDAIEAEMRSDYPNPEFARLRQGKITGLAARNIADGDEALVQYHLLYPHRDASMLLRARVTATPDEGTDAANLAEMILNSCQFAPAKPDKAPEKKRAEGKADWWHEALALEANNQLEAAEKHIRDHVPHIAFAASTADMYRLRMWRLRSQGDEAGALKAFKKADRFIHFYASLATSGGEGAALSRERDQFRARLVAEFGHDPEALPA